MNKFFQYTLIILLIIGFTMNHQQQMLAALLKTPFEVFELTKTLVLSLCLWIIKSYSGFTDDGPFYLSFKTNS